MHTSTNPGKRVKLHLRGGKQATGKFVERNSRSVVLDTGRHAVADIDKFIVVKGK